MTWPAGDVPQFCRIIRSSFPQASCFIATIAPNKQLFYLFLHRFQLTYQAIQLAGDCPRVPILLNPILGQSTHPIPHAIQYQRGFLCILKNLTVSAEKRGLHPLYNLFRTISDRWFEKVRDDLQSHRTEWQSGCSWRNSWNPHGTDEYICYNDFTVILRIYQTALTQRTWLAVGHTPPAGLRSW